MAIQYEHEADGEWFKSNAKNVPETCMICSEKLGKGPLIYWFGGDLQLWLHPECALTLGCNLIHDAKTLNVKCR